MATATGIKVEKLENLVKIMRDMEKFDKDTDISSITVKIDQQVTATITRNVNKEWTASLNISETSGNYMDR